MSNKGQTTIFFSLMISVLFLFSLSALEMGRIYMGKIKVRAVFHSTCSSLLADYNSELFERYHLLFMDPTYGTGSEAALEEKAVDYLETSLNGEEKVGNGIYKFHINELMLTDRESILDSDMALLKKQVADYERTAGFLYNAKNLAKRLEENRANMDAATRETQQNGVKLSLENTGNSDSLVEVTDPRDTLKKMLSAGILSVTLPENTDISKEAYILKDAPSKGYEDIKETAHDNNFQSISALMQALKKDTDDNIAENLYSQAAFVGYVRHHFSNGVRQPRDSVHKCEIEYILKGKESDYENMEAVVNEIVWLRMPVNYTYLLSDTEKKGEALTMAAAICTATGTEGFIEVVKYLLLGCWAYAESVCEMRTLLSGEQIPYIKTKETWTTDLKTLKGNAGANAVEQGLRYEDYLSVLLAKKHGNGLNSCYARMLDIIDCNLKQKDSGFCLKRCVGKLVIQAEISENSHFVKGKDISLYSFYLEEKTGYE